MGQWDNGVDEFPSSCDFTLRKLFHRGSSIFVCETSHLFHQIVVSLCHRGRTFVRSEPPRHVQPPSTLSLWEINQNEMSVLSFRLFITSLLRSLHYFNEVSYRYSLLEFEWRSIPVRAQYRNEVSMTVGEEPISLLLPACVPLHLSTSGKYRDQYWSCCDRPPQEHSSLVFDHGSQP